MKPDGRAGTVKEQIIEDPVLGMTLQISVSAKGVTKLIILGNFPLGNREHLFYPDGSHMGAGTYLTHCPIPNWLQLVKE